MDCDSQAELACVQRHDEEGDAPGYASGCAQLSTRQRSALRRFETGGPVNAGRVARNPDRRNLTVGLNPQLSGVTLRRQPVATLHNMRLPGTWSVLRPSVWSPESSDPAGY